jgi:hypothetical protein
MKFFRYGICSSLILCSASFAYAEDLSPQSDLLLKPMVQKSKVLGKTLSFEEKAQALSSGLGVLSETQSQFLGQTTSLVSASVEAVPPAAPLPGATPIPGATPAGIELGRTDLYIGGTRVWAGDLRFVNGALVYTGGVAPTQIPFPLFMYPLGPVMLELDAGVEFEGALVASLTPGLSYPLQDSSLDAKVEAKLAAAAYIQGYASLYIVRAGVGGRVDIVEGTTGVEAHLLLNGQKPYADYLGKVVLLKGDVYGFVDTNILFGRWTRVLHKSFFSWPGKCFAFGVNSCAKP